MTTIKLNDEIFKELHILKKSEWDKIGNDYKGTSIFDKSIKTAFLPGYGTTLFFENKHFIIINDREPVKKFAIWRNHKVILLNTEYLLIQQSLIGSWHSHYM